MHYIGIDVSKRLHVAANAQGLVFPFTNTVHGFQRLIDWAGNAVFSLEPTGHYYHLLAQFLNSKGLQVLLINGRDSKIAKQLLFKSPDKTDAKDAHILAKMAAMGLGSEYRGKGQPYISFRRLVDFHNQLTKDRRTWANQAHKCIDLLFPELSSIIDLRCKSDLRLLSDIPSPSLLLDIGEHGLGSRYKLRAGKCKALIELAKQGTAGEYCGITALSLGRLTASLLESSELNDTIKSQALGLLQQVPYAENLQTIPCIGHWTVYTILGTLGDISKYSSSKQLLKQAGLNLLNRQSGGSSGRAYISRRGRPELRAALYYSLLHSTKPGHAFYAFYSSKRAKGNHKKAMVSLMRKALTVAWVVALKNEPFNAEATGLTSLP